MSEGLLNQYISVLTRGENILDLFFTNDDSLVTNVSVSDTDMSDHIVDIMLSSNPVCPETVHMKTFDANSFRSLDFNKADYEKLNTKLSMVDWTTLRQSCSLEEFPHHFTDTLLQICQSTVPVKKVSRGRPMSYQISSGDTMYPTNDLRDLGVQVTSELSWSKHVSNITRKGRTVASWVFSVFKTRNTETMLTLYKSLVRSHLEYCCPLWNPSKITDIQLLEGVQRTFTTKTWGVQHLDYWDRLKALNLMSLQRRRERYIIIQI